MATTNTQPTTRNGGPAVGDPQAASENDMSASQSGQTAADQLSLRSRQSGRESDWWQPRRE